MKKIIMVLISLISINVLADQEKFSIQANQNLDICSEKYHCTKATDSVKNDVIHLTRTTDGDLFGIYEFSIGGDTVDFTTSILITKVKSKSTGKPFYKIESRYFDTSSNQEKPIGAIRIQSIDKGIWMTVQGPEVKDGIYTSRLRSKVYISKFK